MSLKRTRGLSVLAAVVIVLALVVGPVLVYAEFGPIPWMPSARWWGLATVTGLLFWDATTTYGRYRSQPWFWLTLGVFFSIHICAWTLVLLQAREWGLLWFVPPAALEAALLVLLINTVGLKKAGHGKSGVLEPPREKP
jgi:hypothetical protein